MCCVTPLQEYLFSVSCYGDGVITISKGGPMVAADDLRWLLDVEVLLFELWVARLC